MENLPEKWKVLDLLETCERLNKKEAKEVASAIDSLDEDSRLAKGKWWNACKHGTRKKLCELNGWKMYTIQEYGIFANDFKLLSSNLGKCPDLTYTLWRAADEETSSKKERLAILTTALKRNWTAKHLRENLRAKKQKVHDEKKPPRPEPKPNPDKEKEFQEYLDDLKRAGDAMTRRAQMLTVDKAANAFGIQLHPFAFTAETLKVLYRHYSKSCHPDTGGSEKAMTHLNECKNLLEGQLYES